MIAQAELQNFFTSQNVASFEELNFKIAWGVEGYHDRVSRDD